MEVNHPRPFPIWLLIILLLFLGIAGLISGLMLIIQPDGSLMKMPLSYLDGSNFSNYLVPGVILFFFIGVVQVLAGLSLLLVPKWQGPNIINPFKESHWSWTLSWASGIIMLIWISVETILLGYISILQPIIAVWAIVLIILTFSPSVRDFYKGKRR